MRVYDPQLVTISFDGIVLTGFSEDSMVEVEREEEANLPYTGVLGEHTTAVNANKNHLAKLSFASTSPHLPMLRKIANSSEPERAFSIVDMNSNENISTDRAYIVTPPPYIRGKEIEDVEVEIRLVNPLFS